MYFTPCLILFSQALALGLLSQTSSSGAQFSVSQRVFCRIVEYEIKTYQRIVLADLLSHWLEPREVNQNSSVNS